MIGTPLTEMVSVSVPGTLYVILRTPKLTSVTSEIFFPSLTRKCSV